MRWRSTTNGWAARSWSPCRRSTAPATRSWAACTWPVISREQKRAESLAVEAVRQRDQFLAMLSHELRNPLGAILNAACVVKRMPAQTGPFGEALAVIERQAQQMSSLLDDLLDVSRVMQGKISMAQEEVDLAGVATDAVAAVRSSLDARNQQLVFEMPGAAPVRARRSDAVAANPGQLADERRQVHPAGRADFAPAAA